MEQEIEIKNGVETTLNASGTASSGDSFEKAFEEGMKARAEMKPYEHLKNSKPFLIELQAYTSVIFQLYPIYIVAGLVNVVLVKFLSPEKLSVKKIIFSALTPFVTIVSSLLFMFVVSYIFSRMEKYPGDGLGQFVPVISITLIFAAFVNLGLMKYTVGLSYGKATIVALVDMVIAGTVMMLH